MPRSRRLEIILVAAISVTALYGIRTFRETRDSLVERQRVGEFVRRQDAIRNADLTKPPMPSNEELELIFASLDAAGAIALGSAYVR